MSRHHLHHTFLCICITAALVGRELFWKGLGVGTSSVPGTLLMIQGHSSQSILLRSLHIRYCDTKFPELETDMQETRESIPVCVARVGFAFSLLPSNTALLQNPSSLSGTHRLSKAVWAVFLVPQGSLILTNRSTDSFLAFLHLYPSFSRPTWELRGNLAVLTHPSLSV